MCYSFNTSVVSYTLGLLSAVFALYSKQYILGFFILFFIQIQLSEAIIWKGIDTDNVRLNKIGTRLGKYLLPSHVIGISIGILISQYYNNKLGPRDFVPLVVGILFYVWVVSTQYNSDDKLESYPQDRNCKKNCQNSRNR
jgi:hypothetical protein